MGPPVIGLGHIESLSCGASLAAGEMGCRLINVKSAGGT